MFTPMRSRAWERSNPRFPKIIINKDLVVYSVLDGNLEGA